MTPLVPPELIHQLPKGSREKRPFVAMLHISSQAFLILGMMAFGIAYPAVAAPKRDPFVGQYAVSCDRKGVQCWYEITPISNAKRQYRVVFTVADRMNAAAILCTVSGAGEVRADGTLFIVQPAGSSLYIRRETGGDLSIEQARLGICGGIYASGTASFIGD